MSETTCLLRRKSSHVRILMISLFAEEPVPRGPLRQSAHVVFLLLFLVLIAPGSLSAVRTDTSPLTVTFTPRLKLTVTQGGGAVRSRALELKNPGNEKLAWSASTNQAWLRFEPASGSLAPKATASIEFVADP